MRVFQFFRESRAELRKVVWPSRENVIASVKVVIGLTVVVSVFLGALDLGFTQAFRFIMQ